MAQRMNPLLDDQEGNVHLMLGNEAIVRGALEAGVSVAAAYPGTPSSEIVDNFSKVSKDRNIYVEWSVNEKVSAEVAAAGSLSGLRSMCSMKQNGLNVASDFLLHLALAGTRAGYVLVPAEDPGAISSQNEGESRHFARLLEIPIIEPGDFQEMKDMTRWAFELSEEIRNMVMVRSCTRLSHASGKVTVGKLPVPASNAHFRFDGNILDSQTGPVISMPTPLKHKWQQDKIAKVTEIFETSPFNKYFGPKKPELMIFTSSAAFLYTKEAVAMLGLEKKAGILKLGTTWPMPKKLVKKHLTMSDNVLFVEEVLPFLEEQIKMIAAEEAKDVGIKTFYGKNDGAIPMFGELNPDIVIGALSKITGITYEGVPKEYRDAVGIEAMKHLPPRELTFCPGCPHRASYWNIHNTLEIIGGEGFVNGDVGCYGMGIIGAGYSTVKTDFAMGSGTGVASGFGKLGQFNMNQPVLSICGDSTFFHAGMPALVNAVHNRSNMIMVILDNSGTAMTGFQPHPGLTVDAMGADDMPAVDIEGVCRAIGAETVVHDPFDIEGTRRVLLDLLEDREGTRVLILKQVCALSPEKRAGKSYEMSVDETKCIADRCGCNRICTRVFRCPGLRWDRANRRVTIDEVICSGCGVCADICPAGAIQRVPVQKTEEVA